VAVDGVLVEVDVDHGVGELVLGDLRQVLGRVGLQLLEEHALGRDLAHSLCVVWVACDRLEEKLTYYTQLAKPLGIQRGARTCRSAEHDTPMPTGHDAPWRGRRITRTSWQKYLPPNCAPMLRTGRKGNDREPNRARNDGGGGGE
jgi:hypothetical protein